MTDLRLYNTLTRRKDAFTPADGKTVRIYACGPTVYNYAHIGNLRTYLFEDLLRRVLENVMGWSVDHVVNITDVGHMTSDGDAGEDKMAKAAARENRSPWELARFYEDAFIHDLKRLNIEQPRVLSRATEHVEQMIALIQELEGRGYAYRTQEGIYFDTARDADYGKLAGLNFAGQRQGAREEVNVDPEKRHPSDFILWFTNKPSHIMKWDSPWGVGYPGWHIECSAMAMHYLGQTLDIHCGGIDHIPVHNTNEIAQSECATGHTFARFWIHGAFLNVKGSGGPGHTKMAKSGENFITVDKLIQRDYDPIAYRYLTLTTHYRSELAFSWESLDAASKALRRIYNLAHRSNGQEPLNEAQQEVAVGQISAALCDDINAARAIALLHEYESPALWERFDSVLGLDYVSKSEKAVLAFDGALPNKLSEIISERDAARAVRNYTRADELRRQLKTMGYYPSDNLTPVH